MQADLSIAAARLDGRIEHDAFLGWDPFDALNSRLVKRLTFGRRRLGQVWVQLFKRSPLNLRPILGVPKGYNPMGMGVFLASYWRKYLLCGDPAHLSYTKHFADWLRQNASPGYRGACWGYNFDWPNRGFFAPAHTPTVVNTGFIGLAFLDLLALSGPDERQRWDGDALSIACSACDFVRHDLQTDRPLADELTFSYTPLDRRVVHNANVLGAWLLAEVASRTGEAELGEMALAAARYTARRQLPNGAWLYGEGRGDQWIDNFHTGYVLTALRRIGQVLNTPEFVAAVERGYSFWKSHFFTTAGAPKYYAERLYPIDIHCASQAILTFLAFSQQDAEAVTRARDLAHWTVKHMQMPSGEFRYQIHPAYGIDIPYMRWSQAWMQRAFVELDWNSQP